jgi:5'-nucleotidase|nr:bifunctional UDP-sugar hydrolase/5'-nucleotidase [Bacillus infantis]MCR6612586.1 bifunctional metallophosphatase/5'-nucleotidase [Bacillus infantis]
MGKGKKVSCLKEVIHIYHTNDLHSHFSRWPRIHRLLTERRKWHEEAGEDFFFFDIGDHADRWHPLTEATGGKCNTELLNEAGCTAAAIGNNEGITLPFDSLDTLYEKAAFDVITVNLFYKDGRRPGWVKPYAVYETVSGLRVAAVGVTANYQHFYDLLGWKLTDPFEELRKVLPEVREHADIIVILSHLGIHDDERLAAEFPEADVILGGHTHHILHEGKLVEGSLLAAAGKHGFYAGHVMLEIDTETNTAIGKKAQLYDTNELPPAVNEELIIEELYRKGKSLLDVPAASLPDGGIGNKQLAVLLCDALMEKCGADAALLNEGLILEGLEKNEATLYDLHRICPHPINPCKVMLTGAELKEVLIHAKSDEWEHLQVKGLGFRGTLMGKMISAGIEMDSSGNVEIGGQALDSEKSYSLAIPDMFTFGPFFPEIRRAASKEYFFPDFLRHLLEWKLQHQ